MRVTNPYVAGNPVGETPIFVGREDIMDEVMAVLESDSQMGIVLYGQRRIGKTSILQKLNGFMDATETYIPVMFDLQYKASNPLDDVISELANSIANKAKVNSPVFSQSPSKEFPTNWLPMILDQIGRDKKIVVLFDEFDVLTEQDDVNAGTALFPYLSKLLKTSKTNLKFVFVLGRNIDDISAIAYQFLKGIHPKRISLLSKEDTCELVQLSEKNNSLKWEQNALDTVWDLTHGHPYLTQAMCWETWNKLRSKNPETPPVVTSKHVLSAIPGTFELGKLSLQWLWNGLGPAEKIVVSALAQADTRVVSEDTLRKILHDSGIRIIFRELNDAPKLLQDWDIIEPIDDGYSFKVELLRKWIKANKPLNKVYEENDSIQPIANNYYQIAKRLYNDKKLDAAIQDLNRAIDAYPNHQGANQLLSDILMEQNKLTDAKSVLEKCVETYPSWAKPKLIEVLLKIVKALKDPDQRLDIFEQTLKLDKSQPDALKGKWEILRERIAHLEKAKKYDDALLIANKLKNEYPDQSEWSQVCTRLIQKIELPKIFKEAKNLVDRNKDKSKAIDLLLHILNLDPYYEGAASYLNRAVSDKRVQIPHLAIQALFYNEEGMANWLRSTIIWLPFLLLVRGIWLGDVKVPDELTWLNTFVVLRVLIGIIIICWLLCIWLGRSNISAVLCALPMLAFAFGTVLILTRSGPNSIIWIYLIAESFAFIAISIIDNIEDMPKGLDIISLILAITVIYLTPGLAMVVGVIEIVAAFVILGALIGFIGGLSEGIRDSFIFMGIGTGVGLLLAIVPSVVNFQYNQAWLIQGNFWEALGRTGILMISYVGMIGLGLGYFFMQLNDFKSTTKKATLVVAPALLLFLIWLVVLDGWNILILS